MTNQSKLYAIIVAGGSGTRMGGSLPKQFMLLKGEPILMHTIRKFHSFNREMKLVVVLPSDQMDTWKQLCDEYNFTIPHTLITGGFTRFHSVKNALSQTGTEGLIAVHDGVRPLVSQETISRCFKVATQQGTAVPVIPLNDSVRQLHGDTSQVIDRDTLRLVQTPQVFKALLLHNAYNEPFRPEFTDDASVVQHCGTNISLTEGNSENIKITRPLDMLIAEVLVE